MRTIEVLPVGAEYALISQMVRSLGVTQRTVERYLVWAIASELSPFADYRKGGPLNLLQQRALKEIRKGRRLRLPDYQIAEQVEALSLPPQLSLDTVADWLRRRVPAQFAEDFVAKLYEDFSDEIAEIS